MVEEESKEESEIGKISNKLKENPWIITTFVLLIGGLILVVLALKPGLTGNVVSGVDAGSKLVDYLNSNVGGGVEYISYEDLGNIYKINVKYQGQEIPVYSTKDGKYLIQSLVPITGQTIEPIQEAQEQEVAEVSVDDDAVKGNANAPVTIVEFSDYECPFCGRHFTQTLPQIISEYVNTGKVKLVFRDFPLSFHENAQKAAEAAECAGLEGDDKYWEIHNKLFQNQEALDVASLKKYAKELGLNTEKFNNCLDTGKMEEEVLNDMEDGQSYGVSGTPAFFINGRKVTGAQPFSVFKEIIDEELNK